MRFTKDMYEQAIKDLQDGLTQLAPDGHCCAICGDSGHQAFECGSNPLVAMALCQGIVVRAGELHDKQHELESFAGPDKPCTHPLEVNCHLCDNSSATQTFLESAHDFLHWLSGSCTWMGELVGPGKVKRLYYVCINCDQRVDDAEEHFDKTATSRTYWKCSKREPLTIDSDLRAEHVPPANQERDQLKRDLAEACDVVEELTGLYCRQAIDLAKRYPNDNVTMSGRPALLSARIAELRKRSA